MVLALSWALWKYTHSIAFPFGMAVLYFWSLHGAWAIVTDRLGGDSQMHYHYLYEKMFPVYLDECYAWTLGLYAAFLLVVALTVLFSVRPARLPTTSLTPVILSHDKLIVICGLAVLTSVWAIHDSLGSAIQAGTSGYVTTRTVTDDMSWFRFHQELNRVALVPAAIGFAALLSGGQCRYLAGRRSLRHLAGYAVVLGFMFCFCVALGNKSELAMALFSGCLFYVANSTQPKTGRLALAGTALIACIGFIDFARGLAVNDITHNLSFGELAYSLVRLANSNEGFAAHMSLYGAIYYNIPLTYGSSIVSFLASIVPRTFWADRPYDVYTYYAQSVNATEGQGYSIHHAAGWYLNFGVPGVILGALLLGRIWAALYNIFVHDALLPRNNLWRVFCIVAFVTFTANVPNLVRAGPEGYKAILVDSFFIPVSVLMLSRVRKRANSQAPITHRRQAIGRLRPSLAATTGMRRSQTNSRHKIGSD
jgi:oligosaccharide repeat unit polymerase